MGSRPKARALLAAERILGRPVTLEELGRMLKAEEAGSFWDWTSLPFDMTCRGELTYIKTGNKLHTS